MDRTYDIIIVGAGPAGSMAARKCAESGIDVLMLDKRQEIGSPKRCAEAISTAGLKKVGLEPSPKWVVNTIYGASLYTPSGKHVDMQYDEPMGYLVERKMFDKTLAVDAINAGAACMVNAHVSGLRKSNGAVQGVIVDYMDEKMEISSKLVIAADGVDSKIARIAGIDTTHKLIDYHSCLQYEMAGLREIETSVLRIYLGSEVAPRGYAWIFPKGDGVANVGMGIRARKSVKSVKHYLDKLIQSHPDIFKHASPVEINAGGVPLGERVDSLVVDGLMVVGDAGHMVNPIHGGGIANAMLAGQIAAKVAADAVKKGDVSAETLREYERLWDADKGELSANLFLARKMVENLTDEQMEQLADALTGKDIMKVIDGKYKFISKMLTSK